MGIIKDHGIIATLKDGNLRNDPEVLELLCDVLEAQDRDIEELGGFVISKDLDNKLELLNTAVDRAENEYQENGNEENGNEEDEDEDEDEEDEEDELDFENGSILADDDEDDEDEDEDRKAP